MEFYRQTTAYTGAAASLLMVLHKIKNVTMSREQEFSIWQSSANLPVRASSIYALALVAQEHGIVPRIILEEKEYDYPDYVEKGYSKKEIDEAKFSSRMYAKKASQQNISIELREVTQKLVLDLLAKNKIILLRVNAGVLRKGKSVSKYVVVYKEKKGFVAMDPKFGPVSIDAHTLERCMTSLQVDKKRDVRLLVFD